MPFTLTASIVYTIRIDSAQRHQGEKNTPGIFSHCSQSIFSWTQLNFLNTAEFFKVTPSLTTNQNQEVVGQY